MLQYYIQLQIQTNLNTTNEIENAENFWVFDLCSECSFL
jgi:hypothetical protein